MKRSLDPKDRSMTYSLDTLSIQTLKTEAKALREERGPTGAPLTHGAALEEVARRHGYRDWNTASAALPQRFSVPVQVGQRVQGTYLSRPFTGLVVAMKLLSDMRHCEVTVAFDKPVNVSKFASMVHNRQRVTATVGPDGISPAHTSDGEPHMRVRKA
jgi:Glyoxalase superfamily protein